MGLSIVTGGNSPTETTQESSLTTEVNEQTQEVQEQVETAPSEQQTQGEEQPQQAEQQEVSQESDSGQAPTLDDDSVLSYLESKIGRKVSLDELKNPVAPTQESVYANDELASIDKFVKETGRTVQDYYTMKSLDFEGIDDIDLVRKYLKLSDPELTSEEIDADIQTRYKLGGEYEGYSEREVLAAKANLKRDLKKIKSEINTVKETYLKPIEKASTNNSPSETEIAALREGVSNAAEQIGEIEFGDKVKWKYGVTDDARKEAMEAVQSMTPEQLSIYSDEKGNIDYQAAVGTELIVQNYSAIAEGIWSAAQDALRAETVKDRKNINIPEQTAQANTNVDTDKQAIINHLRNQHKRTGLSIQTG
jgi:hypothetical protein